MTNINVWSFEEALYHCFSRWKESSEDFVSDEFIEWVGEKLNLPVIASQIREIRDIDSFSKKYLAFLSITDYLSTDALNSVSTELSAWESRLEWEKLKDRADYLTRRGEIEKALVLYRRAISFEPENAGVYNNIAVTLMKMGRYQEAAKHLLTAMEIDNSLSICLNFAEALILNGELERASSLLKQTEALWGQHADILYFRGLIEFYSNRFNACAELFEKAIEKDPNPHYIYRLSDVYVRRREYEKSIGTLDRIQVKDKFYYKKLADVHAASGNLTAAIRCIEDAGTTVETLTKLASYCRQAHKLDRAAAAAKKALAINSSDPRANFEWAKIKKDEAQTTEYKNTLHKVLELFKDEYRNKAQ
jgi:tetratricopeptide (TPR) repeat protein